MPSRSFIVMFVLCSAHSKIYLLVIHLEAEVSSKKFCSRSFSSLNHSLLAGASYNKLIMDRRELINKIERNRQECIKTSLSVFFPYLAGCHTKEFNKNVRKKRY